MTVGRLLGGRYQLEALLGSGGMATVWLGLDLRLDRRVAIKELSGPGLHEPMAVERFDREARTVAGLSHPNIVAVHDFGADDDRPYLVMELIGGPAVSAMLAGGPLPIEQAVTIAAQTCDGLAAAHAAGIVHRDVKPANLMLTPAGVVKICDFGIARVLHGSGEPSLTGAAVAMGSGKYMAPEQAYGEQLDARADLYSLGCTMYAMLTGDAPFSGDNVVDILHQHLTRPPVPLREHRADIPAPLESLVMQLLAKTPEDRPADAAEVRSRLAALSQVPTVVTAPTVVTTPASVGAPAPAPVPSPSQSPPAPAALTSGRPSPTAWALIAAGVAIVLAAILVPLLVDARSGPLAAAGTLPRGTPPTASGNRTATPDGPVTGSTRTPAAPAPGATATGATGSTGPSPSTQPGQPSPSAAPTDPVVALRLSIQEQIRSGNLNPDAAGDLYKKVDEIARARDGGDGDTAAKKVTELRGRLAGLLTEGKISALGYAALSLDLDLIVASLP